MGAGAAAMSTTGCGKLLEHPKMKSLDQTLSPLKEASDIDGVRSLCLAFLKAVGGDSESRKYLKSGADTKFADAAQFFDEGVDHVEKELSAGSGDSSAFASALDEANPDGSISGAQGFWKAFFPNGLGLMDDMENKIAELRQKRKVTIETENPQPIVDPITEVLFTSNVLLGLPDENKDIDSLNYSDDFKRKLQETKQEKQQAWFDHPIQIGVEPDGNEILYGLKGLNTAVQWEKDQEKLDANAKMLTLLSITCTHTGLQGIAKQYVEEEFANMKPEDKLSNLIIYLFSEIETDKLVDEVVKPCCDLIGFGDMGLIREVFGVEGQYGRHYSFLKAVLAIMNIFVDDKIKATFKIDIDQLFIQDSLVAETGQSMLEHFKNPLWGAKGKNWKGEDVELGMMAGALCNQKDWELSGHKLFVADVLPPKADKKLAADELVFFSGLPQAISTEAEMMVRSNEKSDAIQRIHVTGGTNGILLDTLLKFRPFCPSFIGRAEDQSYIFSTFCKPGPKLAYIHKPGLIMRHDKEAFAAEAMEAARIGKMVGDYERILLFSEYGKFCSDDFGAVMDLVNPFTGCFCIPLPKTVMFLRFALKALGFVADNAHKDAVDFVLEGSPRVVKCIKFTQKNEGSGQSEMETQWKREQGTWDKFYDALAKGKDKGDASVKDAAQKIFSGATAKC